MPAQTAGNYNAHPQCLFTVCRVTKRQMWTSATTESCKSLLKSRWTWARRRLEVAAELLSTWRRPCGPNRAAWLLRKTMRGAHGRMGLQSA